MYVNVGLLYVCMYVCAYIYTYIVAEVMPVLSTYSLPLGVLKPSTHTRGTKRAASSAGQTLHHTYAHTATHAQTPKSRQDKALGINTTIRYDRSHARSLAILFSIFQNRWATLRVARWRTA